MRRVALLALAALAVAVPLLLAAAVVAGLPWWAWLFASFFWCLVLVRVATRKRPGPLEGGSGPLEGVPGPRWLDLPGGRF